MLKNKKGFTLVEILAAVTILGILSAIAIVSVNKVIEQGKEKHYTTAEKNLELAGQSYAQQNRNELPKVIGQKKIIYLKTLQEKNYIKEVLDYNDNACDINKSYVQIYKYSQDDYSYVPYLECPSYKTSQETIQGNINISITFSTDIAESKANITVNEPNKLMSYNYIVYKGNKEVFNSGSVAVKDYATRVTKNVDISSYTPGNIKIVVSATNIFGYTQTVTKSNNYTDNQGPICKIDAADKKSAVKPWVTDSRKITVHCEDNGTGCARESYTKTFTGTMKTGTITIADEEGNTKDCIVSVYIDNTRPTITVTAYKRTSSGGKGASIASVSTTATFNSKTLDLSNYVDSNWLNGNDYPYGIYYQVTVRDGEQLASYEVKSNTAGLKSNSSGVNTITQIVESATTTTNAKTFTFSTIEDGYRRYRVTARDAAGNTAQVTITAPLDRTAPNQPTVKLYNWKNNSTRPTSATGLSTYTNNTWSKTSVYTTASGSTDMMSDVTYQYTTTGVTANATNAVQNYRSIEASGTSTIKYRACDVAGNCSAYSPIKTIKIDKVAPTCTSSGGSPNWTKNSVTLTGTCDDGDGSGCTQSIVTNVITEEMNSTTQSPGTVTDKVGNSRVCPSQTVKIDRTAPTCTNSGDSTTWTKSDRTITYGCSDLASQCDANYDGGSQKFTTTTKTATISAYTIKDKAGNTNNCPARIANVYVDKTAPSCTTTSTASNYWTNTNVTLTGTCNDGDGSGCVSSTITKTFTEETEEYTSPGKVKDNVGNETTCGKKWVMIDKTKPYVNSVSVDGLYVTQWDRSENEVYAYLKDTSCAGFDCTTTICISNVLGKFQLNGFSVDFKDDLSGYYSRERDWKIYAKNGYDAGSGCISTSGHNPCTYRWTYTFYDRAQNSNTYVVNFKIGYIDSDDGTGC